jgi:hypothetical protein
MAACVNAGLHLEIAGSAAGRVEVNVARRLADVDLVFAVGRSAMEAMATGTGCILCDRDGMGPFVSSANVGLLRDYNFGRATATGEISAAALRERLTTYDPAEVSKVQQFVRQELSLDKMIARYEFIYRAVIEDRRPLPDLANDFRRYAEHLGTMVHELMSRGDIADDRFNPESHLRREAVLIRHRLLAASVLVQRKDEGESHRRGIPPCGRGFSRHEDLSVRCGFLCFGAANLTPPMMGHRPR